ncbi:MAG: hypothetical protein IPN17_15040 [Deltaproteobacteria bacterium]|nr:hypothetical protein [Deltaproteobacteria bacterium]
MATRRAATPPKPSTPAKKPASPPPARAAKASEPGAARLRELIEEATVDAYDEEEQRMGFYTMLEDNLAVPFETEVLGVAVQVTEVELNDAQDIVALCQRGRHTQRIAIVDVPLPKPPPEGAEWIAAYRRWRSEQ